ncbi:DUF1573 domain-containing protein [bacterium]|nr:DUF1573 domain-containing protein [bacterium]
MNKDTILPGGEGEIKATLSAGKRSGPMKKSIRVETNDPKNSNVTIFLAANVQVDFSLEPAYLSFGRVSKKDLGTERIVKVVGDDSTKFTITKLEPKGPGYDAQILPPEKEGEGQRISVKLKSDIAVGNFRSDLVVHSNHPKYPTTMININAVVLGHIQIQPERIYFRLIPGQEPEERIVSIMNTDKKQFKILSMNIEPEPIPNSSARQRSLVKYIEASKDDLEIAELEPDVNGNKRVSLKFKKGLNAGERVQGKVVIKTDDKAQETVTLYYHAFSQLPRDAEKGKTTPTKPTK